jgi:hypothetical protein
LAGRWKVALHDADGVQLDFRMTFSVSGNDEPLRWEAYSRPGAARELVGGATATLGRLFGKMPPRESLIYIGEGVAERQGDRLHLTGALESPFLGRRTFTGSLAGGRLQAELTRVASGVKAGTLEAVRDASDGPLRDYPALAADLERAVRATLFDPAVFARREFQRFFADLHRRFASARDDLDAVAAFQALKPSLGISHVELIRNPQLAARSVDDVIAGDPSVNPSGFVRLTFPAPEVAHLRVTKWDRVAPAIDRAFERIDSAKARILILDIRGNPGGDASSIAPFTHLVREPTTIGVFLGRTWYGANPGAPAPRELSDVRVLASGASPAQLLSDLREHGAVVGKAVPRAPHFAGPVYLLVDRRTGSASEPLAHALKVARRATLIGERTAGAMLMALPHPLRDGWIATIPEADFIAADGTRLEGKGVEPHVKTESNGVFFAVADRIETELPYSAAVLRGGSHTTLNRPQEAERAYRSALRVVDRQRPAPGAASRASVHRRLAGILSARGDKQGALREYAEVLKLVPDDAEALAAMKGGA